MSKKLTIDSTKNIPWSDWLNKVKFESDRVRFGNDAFETHILGKFPNERSSINFDPANSDKDYSAQVLLIYSTPKPKINGAPMNTRLIIACPKCSSLVKYIVNGYQNTKHMTEETKQFREKNLERSYECPSCEYRFTGEEGLIQ